MPSVPRHSFSWKRLSSVVFFTVWVGVATFFGSTLAASHLVTLPSPDASDMTLRDALVAERPVSAQGQWMVVHLLYSECKCSLRILEHFLESQRPDDVYERVVMVGDVPDFVAGARRRGFDVELVEAIALEERYHVEAVPLMVVLSPDDQIRYIISSLCWRSCLSSPTRW